MNISKKFIHKGKKKNNSQRSLASSYKIEQTEPPKKEKPSNSIDSKNIPINANKNIICSKKKSSRRGAGRVFHKNEIPDLERTLEAETEKLKLVEVEQDDEMARNAPTTISVHMESSPLTRKTVAKPKRNSMKVLPIESEAEIMQPVNFLSVEKPRKPKKSKSSNDITSLSSGENRNANDPRYSVGININNLLMSKTTIDGDNILRTGSSSDEFSSAGPKRKKSFGEFFPNAEEHLSKGSSELSNSKSNTISLRRSMNSPIPSKITEKPINIKHMLLKELYHLPQVSPFPLFYFKRYTMDFILKT
ncbi:hypothetical protein BB560_003946 [Smittium megazygosporum]|uniref:Uncharacterized protein n=1 Tax=Smittium megazygosporum TaxID=133381 RepID=A0A2T9ZAN9_9FUNG|nr:hypothetical protein BB560_003946 [Smittium megazygosporum]